MAKGGSLSSGARAFVNRISEITVHSFESRCGRKSNQRQQHTDFMSADDVCWLSQWSEPNDDFALLHCNPAYRVSMFFFHFLPAGCFPAFNVYLFD
jgi:hypothetical protein